MAGWFGWQVSGSPTYPAISYFPVGLSWPASERILVSRLERRPRQRRGAPSGKARRNGPREITAINKFELQTHLNSLAEVYSRSVVKKGSTRGDFRRSDGTENCTRWSHRKLKTPRTRKPCEQFLTMEEYVAPMEALPTTRDRIIVRLATTLHLASCLHCVGTIFERTACGSMKAYPDLKNRVSKRRRLRTARHS